MNHGRRSAASAFFNSLLGAKTKMNTTTTTEPTGKRGRNGSVVLTDRM
jgi:hypothetical protein